ncbi:M3 family metallopeptidase [soil metagenome]
MPSLSPDNPFAAPSTLDHGLPPFDTITEEHFLPAFLTGMAEHLSEVEAVSHDPAPPTIANTLDALEGSGALLGRVSHVFYNLLGSDVTDGLRSIEAEVAPLLSAHRDAVLMDAGVLARVTALRENAGDDVTPEQARLVERYHLDAVRAGAALDADDQRRLREINSELSVLSTEFRNRLSDDTVDLAVHVTDVAELAGLAPDAVDSAAAAAADRGLAGHLLALVLPTSQPALASLHDRALRERLHRASVSRGRRGNAHDTRDVLTRIAALRAQLAALLGYPDHASYVVADQTAGSVDAVLTMLGSLVEPAVANARAEAEALTARLHADGFTGDLQAWDWAYYAAQEARGRTDADALRPHFELGRVVRDGVFAAAEGLYGLTFLPRPDLPTYHRDVQTYEVFDGPVGEAGRGTALFVADWYARDSKRGGAWMSSFVDQSHLLDQRPVVVINLNIARPPDGRPTLLTLDQLRTAFHEFGHVLHGLLSDVRYPRLSGTSVPRDFVEYPSQGNEMWAWDADLLARYAVHHETGEPLSPEALDGVRAHEASGQGYATTELLAAALLDQAWHRLGPDDARVAVEDVEAFEADALAGFGVQVDALPPRYGSTYFAHVFAGGYSAGYYSYLWSEVLDADTVDWFTARGGLRRENGEIFRRELLSRGGTVDPMEAFAAVVGRPPRSEPLLARRGLTAS